MSPKVPSQFASICSRWRMKPDQWCDFLRIKKHHHFPCLMQYAFNYPVLFKVLQIWESFESNLQEATHSTDVLHYKKKKKVFRSFICKALLICRSFGAFNWPSNISSYLSPTSSYCPPLKHSRRAATTQNMPFDKKGSGVAREMRSLSRLLSHSPPFHLLLS